MITNHFPSASVPRPKHPTPAKEGGRGSAIRRATVTLYGYALKLFGLKGVLRWVSAEEEMPPPYQDVVVVQDGGLHAVVGYSNGFGMICLGSYPFGQLRESQRVSPEGVYWLSIPEFTKGVYGY